MYAHTVNVIKGAGATIGAGEKNTISPKDELPAPQHRLEVVITTKLKVNISRFLVEEITRQREKDPLCLVIMARQSTTMH